jgi:WD40 repeat protein
VGVREALVVAVSDYRDPKLTRLRAPATDAEQLAEVLRHPEIGGFEVEVVLDPEEAVLRRRLATFFRLDRRPDDLLVVHFSCHGVKNERGELYLAACDTEEDLLTATAISASWLNELITRCRSKRIVVLLDCCFSGSFPFGVRARTGTVVNASAHLEGRGRAVISSSNAMEYAYEGDQLTGEGQPSVFTHAVVAGLRSGEADRDRDHRVSVQDLYDYVYDRVRETTPDQTPNMMSTLEGPLYLARSRYEPPVMPAALQPDLVAALASNLILVRRGAVDELAHLARSPDPAVVLGALQALEALANDDSKTVCERACTVLAEARSAAEASEDARRGDEAGAGTRDTRRRSAGTHPAEPGSEMAKKASAKPAGIGKPAVGRADHQAAPVRMFANATRRSGTVSLSVALVVIVLATMLFLRTRTGADHGSGPPLPTGPSTESPLASQTVMRGHTDTVAAVAYRPDSQQLATASWDATIRLWDPSTGQSMGKPLVGHAGRVASVAYRPDGRQLATAGTDHTVRLWDPDTGLPIGEPLTGHTDAVVALAYRPDGHRLASASWDGTVRLWDPDTGTPVGQPLTGHTDAVGAVAYRPDGHQLATASNDTTVRLWDIDSESPKGTALTGHTGRVGSLAYRPDGRQLASGSWDRTIRRWDTNSGMPIGQPMTGHDDSVVALAYRPDGAELASGSWDRTVRRWDPNSGTPIGEPLTGHADHVAGLAYRPDGRQLASSSSDRTGRLWALPISK